jgi:tetratricopeptide (TPR) repeat protein
LLLPLAPLEAATELTPELARAFTEIETALRHGDATTARTLADTAIVAYPRHSQLWTLRAAAHLAAREWEAAIADCTAALRFDPRSVRALNHRGGAHLARADLAAALADFDAALAIEPRDPVARTYRAQIRRLRGDHFRALEDAHEAIRADSNNAAAYLERASIRAALGDVGAALEDCGTALTVGGLREPALNLRAMLSLERGEHRQARDDFEELLASGSAYSTAARIHLAWLLATTPDDKLRDGARASRLAHEAVARATTPDAAAYDALAAACAEIGDFTAALAAAHRAIAATAPEQKKQLTQRRERVNTFLAGHPHRLPARAPE